MKYTGVCLTEIEHERIRLNAPKCSAAALSRLMGRDPHTIGAWAKLHSVTFGRPIQTRGPYKLTKRDSSARINRMMALACRRAA